MPPLRLKTKQELNLIAVLVISILGVVAVVSTVWSGWLIHEALVYESPNPNGTIDAAVVALIGQMVSIATLTIGGLIAMLTSTGPKPAPPPTVPPSIPATESAPEAMPVKIVGPDPLPTAPEPVVPDEEVPEDVGADGEEPVPVPAATKRTPRRRASGA